MLLTKDKDIRRRPLEIEAILNARVRAFVLTATEPFIFNITRMGYFAELSKRGLDRRAGRRARR